LGQQTSRRFGHEGMMRETYEVFVTLQEPAASDAKRHPQFSVILDFRPFRGEVINLANEIFGFNGWSSSIVSFTIDYVRVCGGQSWQECVC